MKGAKVWGWGEDLELAGRNARMYINKRWKSTTNECSIAILGRKTDKDILFGITVYMSKPEGVEDLVNNLFDIALTKGSKIYFVTVNLYDYMASNERIYRTSLSVMREAYEKREQILIQKFKDHPKVKPLLEGEKTLVILPVTTIFCELESERFNKVIVRTSNCDLDPLLNHSHFIADKLIEHKIATRIIGYDLQNNVDELMIEDLYVREEKVYLWLVHPSTR